MSPPLPLHLPARWDVPTSPWAGPYAAMTLDAHGNLSPCPPVLPLGLGSQLPEKLEFSEELHTRPSPKATSCLFPDTYLVFPRVVRQDPSCIPTAVLLSLAPLSATSGFISTALFLGAPTPAVQHPSSSKCSPRAIPQWCWALKEAPGPLRSGVAAGGHSEPCIPQLSRMLVLLMENYGPNILWKPAHSVDLQGVWL